MPPGTPLLTVTTSVGASATPTMLMSRVPVVDADSPACVVEVAVTVREKSSLESSGGVRVKPANSSWVSVQMVKPGLSGSSTKVPPDNVALTGTPAMVTDRVSDGSFRSAEISSTNVLSSSLVCRPTSCSPSLVRSRSSDGASGRLSSPTKTGIVPEMEVWSPPSISVVVAVTVNVKSPLGPSADSTVSPASSASVSVQVSVAAS